MEEGVANISSGDSAVKITEDECSHSINLLPQQLDSHRNRQSGQQKIGHKTKFVPPLDSEVLGDEDQANMVAEQEQNDPPKTERAILIDASEVQPETSGKPDDKKEP